MKEDLIKGGATKGDIFRFDPRLRQSCRHSDQGPGPILDGDADPVGLGINANLTGTWDLADKTGKILDNGNITETFREKYSEGKGSPAPSAVEDDLLERAAKKIAIKPA